MNDYKNSLFYFEQAWTRHDMIALMPGPPTNVLEVGCGIGKTGTAIKEKYGCEVTGIDINALAVNVARKKNAYKNLLVCDLDQQAIPPEIERESFDVILYPDVLEHLKCPATVLAAHSKLLRPGGTMIASIPNIRHYYILNELLLKGRWEYQDFGILDRTHLRFFTKKEMILLFEEADMKVTNIKPSCLQGAKLFKAINRILSNSLEQFLAAQYLICACNR